MCMRGDSWHVMDYTWIICHVSVMCVWHAEAGRENKGWEMRGRGFFLFFTPFPSPDNTERETS